MVYMCYVQHGLAGAMDSALKIGNLLGFSKLEGVLRRSVKV